MFKAAVFNTLEPPGSSRTLTDSHIVALSETDLPKLCTKLSAIEEESVKLLIPVTLGESDKLKESATVLARL